MKNKLFLIFGILVSGNIFAQWPNNGLLPTGGTFFGTAFPASINIYTNSTLRAQFTTGFALTSLVGNSGDGLRIIDPLGGAGNLDLFTSGNAGGNETHTRFGLNGQISGQNNRFEFYCQGI